MLTTAYRVAVRAPFAMLFAVSSRCVRRPRGNDLAQFKDESKEGILHPVEYKTGGIIYPYQDAKKK